MFTFFLGLFIGGAVGLLTACLCMAAGNADRAEELHIRGEDDGPRK